MAKLSLARAQCAGLGNYLAERTAERPRRYCGLETPTCKLYNSEGIVFFGKLSGDNSVRQVVALNIWSKVSNSKKFKEKVEALKAEQPDNARIVDAVLRAFAQTLSMHPTIDCRGIQANADYRVENNNAQYFIGDLLTSGVCMRAGVQDKTHLLRKSVNELTGKDFTRKEVDSLKAAEKAFNSVASKLAGFVSEIIPPSIDFDNLTLGNVFSDWTINGLCGLQLKIRHLDNVTEAKH